MIALDARPFSFDAICGQKSIVAEMKKRSLTKDFPTVMFFAGDSGVGKTTLALIVAALINDPNPIKCDGYFNPNPESPESKAILNESFNMSCSMYDASKMSKEDVTALEDTISTESFFGGKRVVILDEAQELSRNAKGVTLKLLEKKRPNAHIILCTMNPDAFDISIKSRGIFYKFKKPSISEIAEYLYGIIDKMGLSEKVPDAFIQEGIFTIAENCEGSVRQAVQTLERCLSGEFYTNDQITEAFGMMSNSRLFDIVSLLLNGKKEAFSEIKKLDIKEFFYASYKLISDCLIYQRTGIVDAAWKSDQYKRLDDKKCEVRKLFDIYSSIDTNMGSFFKPTYCMTRLTEVCDTGCKCSSSVASSAVSIPVSNATSSPASSVSEVETPVASLAKRYKVR